MVSKSKNQLSEDRIEKLVDRAFGGIKLKDSKELTEGCFNMAYLIVLEDGRETILKVAPSPDVQVMFSETNIMQTEVETMRLVAQRTAIPVPEIYYYDNSHTIVSSDYFFMSKLPGASFFSLQEELSEVEKEHIHHQVGKFTAEINGITGSQFGYFSQPDRQGFDWFSVFKTMLTGTMEDCKAVSVEYGETEEQILNLLEKDRACFEEIKVPKLVHWDLWAGNVFVEKGCITGLIDFERCLWGDPLMEVGFRSYESRESFYQGYGVKEFSKKEEKRRKWYDLYLFLLALAEGEFRKYESTGVHDWAAGELPRTLQAIRSLNE